MKSVIIYLSRYRSRVMLEVIPSKINRIFAMNFFMGLLAFFLGLLLNIKFLYIAFSLGVLCSLVSNAILLFTVYLLVYKGYKSYISYFRFLLAYALYALTLYLTYFFCSNIYSVLICALGLCSFKLICYFMYILNFLRKKVHKN